MKDLSANVETLKKQLKDARKNVLLFTAELNALKKHSEQHGYLYQVEICLAGIEEGLLAGSEA